MKKSGLPKGVFNHRGRYQAKIGLNRTNYHIGVFNTVEEAEAAYIKMAKEIQEQRIYSTTIGGRQ